MKLHRLETEQWLPLGIQEAWEFFSMPENLDRITPPDMSFEILTGAGERTFAGQIISYKIRPLFNIPMRWVTEITQSENGKYFIDEQIWPLQILASRASLYGKRRWGVNAGYAALCSSWGAFWRARRRICAQKGPRNFRIP